MWEQVLTFHVDSEGKSEAAIGEQGLVLYEVEPALVVTRKRGVEKLKHLPGRCELVMPAHVKNQ